VQLLERLAGRRALAIASEHRPMAAGPTALPRRVQRPRRRLPGLSRQVGPAGGAGAPFYAETSAQAKRMIKRHPRPSPPSPAAPPRGPPAGDRQQHPRSGREGWRLIPMVWPADFEAIYCRPSISSGISFQRWKTAAGDRCSGWMAARPGTLRPVACPRQIPEVPGYLCSLPEAPGPGAWPAGGSAAHPAELIEAPAWAVNRSPAGDAGNAGMPGCRPGPTLGAHRNRQRGLLSRLIAGLLEAEGWQLAGPRPCEPAPLLGRCSAKLAGDRHWPFVKRPSIPL